jgi:octaprenyl-diphosphate synthase
MTLPIIYTLNNGPKSAAKRLRTIIKNHNNEEEAIREAIEIVVSNGGIEYAEQKMHEYGAEAKAMLKAFSNNEAVNALIGLVDYTMIRTK